MNRTFYRVTRDLHLYLGLFISPFVLVFSISVFYLVHSWIPSVAADKTHSRVVTGVNLPIALTNLTGRPLVDALKPVLESINVPGEIGFVQHRVSDETFIIPVSIPGRATTVSLNVPRHEASIVTRETGLADALITLHKSPGGHGPGIRMNWYFMKAWRWFADATVYLTLFITISGVYLWYVLRAERKIGLLLMFAGTVTFFGLIYAVSH
jgi:hypothetical protein